MSRRKTPRESRAPALLMLSNEWRASKLRLIGVAVLSAKLALVPLIFDPSMDMPFVVSKALLSHALAYILVGIMAGLLIRFGRGFYVLSWLHVPVLAFLGANVIAALFATDQTLALYGTHVRMLGLATIVDYVVLYFAVVLLVRNAAEAVIAFACGLGASILVLGYELVQLLGRDPFSWNTDVTLRPFSTIGQTTSLAQYLMVLAVGTVGVGLLVQRLPRLVRALVFVLSGLLLAGAGATATRSAVLGLVAGSAALIALMWFLHPSRWARVGSLVGAGVAIAVLAGLLAWTPLGARLAAIFPAPPADDTSDEPLAQAESSADVRAALYVIAFDMLRERPILGFGPDNFVVGVPKYRAERSPYEIQQSLATSAHGWVTQIAATSGLAGLGSFIATAVLSAALTLRKGFRPLAITGAAMCAAFLGTGLTTINDVGTDWLFWAAAGMIAAVTTHPPSPSSDAVRPAQAARAATSRQTNRRDSQLRRMASVACVGVGLLLALTPVNAWDASRSIRSAQDSRLRGRASEAVVLAVRATTSDPNRAEYWHGLGLAQLAASRSREASAAFERATRQAPYNSRYLGDLARALLLLDNAGESGARARAVAAAEQAARTDPNNPLANLTRAVVMQFTGNLPEATRSIDRALALDPQSGNASLYLTASQIYLAAGRPTDAIRIARLGITFLSPPGSVELRVQLARALVAAGQSADALTELEAALAIQPGYVPAQQLSAEIRAGR